MNYVKILERAADLVSGDRSDSYGDPVDALTQVGIVWGVILGEGPIEPARVALMMAGLKMVRASNQIDHEDSWLDGAAYFAIGGAASARAEG